MGFFLSLSDYQIANTVSLVVLDVRSACIAIGPPIRSFCLVLLFKLCNESGFGKFCFSLIYEVKFKVLMLEYKEINCEKQFFAELYMTE